MGGPADAAGRVPAEGDGVLGGGSGLDHGEHEAGRAEVEGLLGPDGGELREANDGGGEGGGEGAEDGEGAGNVSGAVFHVDDGVVVARYGGYLGEGGGVGEEEDAVEGFAAGEAGLEGGGGGGGGRGWR